MPTLYAVKGLFAQKTLFNLPDRALEVLFGVDHVTASRVVKRVLHTLGAAGPAA